MLPRVALTAALAAPVLAFPWVANHVGMDPEDMARRDSLGPRQAGSAATCPYNPDHVPAAPITEQYPYCGSINGLPGYQTCTNNKVPADGDTAHQYQKPRSTDIRGPCPGLNTAANHNFLARDGITTFDELVSMQQNVYGVGYDLAVVLATLGVGLDGDPVTMKLSIGCDATNRTASAGLGPELGLDGHNKFEGDTSLTRNDYFTSNGDNFEFNRTLYKQMLHNCAGNCSQTQLAKYRFKRYHWSLNHNGQFYYGPKSLLLYGAASFLYELFPSLGNMGVANPTTMKYFFVKEQIPPNWYSRVTPYSILDVSNEINAQYMAHPVPFGGNTGTPNSFVGIGTFGPSFSNSTFSGGAAGVACLLYQIATEDVPSSLGGGGSLSLVSQVFGATMLNPIFSGNGTAAQFGCPLNFNSS